MEKTQQDPFESVYVTESGEHKRLSDLSREEALAALEDACREIEHLRETRGGV